MRVTLQRRGHERRIVIAGSDPARTSIDPRALRILRDGLIYWEQLKSGKAENAKELARSVKRDERYVARSIQLAFLAPEIVTRFIEGRQPAEWTAERLLRIPRLPPSWGDQRTLFGLI